MELTRNVNREWQRDAVAHGEKDETHEHRDKKARNVLALAWRVPRPTRDNTWSRPRTPARSNTNNEKNVVAVWLPHGKRPLPCLEVAEFLGDNLADVDAEAVHDPLSEIRMRRAAEDLDVRHSALQDSHA